MYQYLATELLKINKEVPNIHYGGCCIFAERLAKALTKIGKEPKILALTRYPDNLRNYMAGDRFAMWDIIHAFVEVDGKYADNNGIYEKYQQIMHCGDECYKLVELTLEDIKFMNVNVKGWNRLFDREQTLIIRKKLNQIVNNILNPKLASLIN